MHSILSQLCFVLIFLIQFMPMSYGQKTPMEISIPSEGHYSLGIYDGENCLVRTLLKNEAKQKDSKVVWDFKDDKGNLLPTEEKYTWKLLNLEGAPKLKWVMSVGAECPLDDKGQPRYLSGDIIYATIAVDKTGIYSAGTLADCGPPLTKVSHDFKKCLWQIQFRTDPANDKPKTSDGQAAFDGANDIEVNSKYLYAIGLDTYLSNGKIFAFDKLTGKCLQIEKTTAEPTKRETMPVRMAVTESLIALAYPKMNMIRFLDANTLKETGVLSCTNPERVAFLDPKSNSNAWHIAFTSDTNLCTAQTGKQPEVIFNQVPVPEPDGKKSAPMTVADGQILLVDGVKGTIQKINPKDGKVISTIANPIKTTATSKGISEYAMDITVADNGDIYLQNLTGMVIVYGPKSDTFKNKYFQGCFYFDTGRFFQSEKGLDVYISRIEGTIDRFKVDLDQKTQAYTGTWEHDSTSKGLGAIQQILNRDHQPTIITTQKVFLPQEDGSLKNIGVNADNKMGFDENANNQFDPEESRYKGGTWSLGNNYFSQVTGDLILTVAPIPSWKEGRPQIDWEKLKQLGPLSGFFGKEFLKEYVYVWHSQPLISKDQKHILISLGGAKGINREKVYWPATEVSTNGGHFKIRISDGKVIWRTGYINSQWADKETGGFGSPNNGKVMESHDLIFTFDRATYGPTIWTKDGLLLGWGLQGNLKDPKNQLQLQSNMSSGDGFRDIPDPLKFWLGRADYVSGDIIYWKGKYYLLQFNVNRGEIYEIQLPPTQETTGSI